MSESVAKQDRPRNEPQQTDLQNLIKLKETSAAKLTKAVSATSANDPKIYGGYYALVIGIDNYEHLSKLGSARGDALAVKDMLETKYDFNVTLLLDATRAEILKGLARLRRTLTKNDNLLIYYAGHGWVDEDENQGYWLPIDAESDDSTYYISNTTVTDKVRSMLAKHVLVVADSCYSGKALRGLKIQRRTPGYYEKMARKKARLILTSGGVEPVMDSGGTDGHSVFASAFLRVLRNNEKRFDGSLLFNEIRQNVVKNSDQTPEYAPIHKSGDDGGDFIFLPKPGSTGQ